MNWSCPLCRSELVENNNQLRCENNHSFDRAKEGYVHLLPVQKKHSLNPGDNKAMLRARRHFLDRGYFAPVADKAQAMIAERNCNVLLDIGCGEGYYSNKLAELGNVKGIDISKDALKLAAKKYKQLDFAVASSYDMPISTASIELAFCCFAPIQSQELARVLVEQGYFLRVTPGAMHLHELKQRIYQTPQAHEETSGDFAHFALQQQASVNTQFTPKNAEDFLALMEMTPFAWKLSPEQKQTLADAPFAITLDMQLSLYQKQA